MIRRRGALIEDLRDGATPGSRRYPRSHYTRRTRAGRATVLSLLILATCCWGGMLIGQIAVSEDRPFGGSALRDRLALADDAKTRQAYREAAAETWPRHDEK